MSIRLPLLAAYTIAFSVFNIIISVLYYVYGWVVHKRKCETISFPELTIEQTKYLAEIEFANVQRRWITNFCSSIRNLSVSYLFVSEIVCFVAMYFTREYILICRISFSAAALLFIILVFLLFYVNKKYNKLAEKNKANLKRTLDEFEKIKNTKPANKCQ